MHKPTAGYTLIQLCEKVSPLSCTNWLLCPCRALDSCQGPWIALQLVSRWRGNRFLSPSFLCLSAISLPERKMSRQGKQRRKNKPTKKHEIWRVRVKKSVWEKQTKETIIWTISGDAWCGKGKKQVILLDSCIHSYRESNTIAMWPTIHQTVE